MKRAIEKNRWRLLTLWILIFTACTIWLIVESRNENNARLKDIDKSRIESCENARTDLQNLLNIVTAKARQTFTKKQKKQYDTLLTQFSPSRCS